MSALIAGIDLSSKRIDAALISLDPSDGSDAPPVTLRSFEMPTWKGETTPAFRTVERCRVVRAAMRELLERFDALEANEDTGLWESYEVVHVCVEEPFGGGRGHRPSDNVLRELYGAILASIPSHIERDTYRTKDWRNDLWPPGHSVIFDGDLPTAPGLKGYAICYAKSQTGIVMDEHQAEAYCVARACRKRLDEAFAREAS